MSATYGFDDRPAGGHPLAPGAAPSAIRAALLAGDQTAFDGAYAGALAQARREFDLSGLFATLEHWRQIAVLQSDRVGYRRMVRRAAETLTGQPVPDDEPLDVTRARIGI